MRFRRYGVIGFVIAAVLALSTDAFAGRYARVFGQSQNKQRTEAQAQKTGQEKPYNELIKDRVVISGLFTFYQDTTDNSMFMAIKPSQIGPLYLCGQTRTSAEGAFFDNGSMGESFPFYFQRVGKQIMVIEKNLRFRADSSSTMEKAVERGVSDGLYASTVIKSQPNDSGWILVDPSDLFIRDAENINFFLGMSGKMGISFDKQNSYFEQVKSFPKNTEVDVKLHYRTSIPVDAPTMQDPYSMFHGYHYSLSTLEESPDFTPRLADDRVGYFLTMYEDYTNMDTESPYVRFINRWNLHKKNPGARMSEPVEPIVYWVENTVPQEYRDAFAEGIEFWNTAFEKLGFRNAIIAKQMPDTATWDPADVRYNTVRWIVMPGGGYAVGPSHANPFTGQIYDADIRVSADFIRYMFSNMQNFIKPVSFNGTFPEEDTLQTELRHGPNYCNYESASAMEAAFGLSVINSVANTLADKDSLTKEYVHSYIVELVAHEVGHTLGLRHNFKSSAIYTLDQIQNRDFTTQHALTGSIMDYAPPNLAGPNKPQGEFYSSVPGPYDMWAIEYGYTDFGDMPATDQDLKLKEIASRASDPMLAYGTDEDAFGSSPKSIDPMCNLFDLGNDPLAYCKQKIDLTNYLWKNSIKEFEKPGASYEKIMNVFQTGWRSYFESAGFAAKYVGGLYHYRDHIGDPNGRVPFVPVAAADQRRAMTFLRDYIFAPEAFSLPADLWNKLQPERLPDFQFAVYTTPQVDYPIHQMALAAQNAVISRMYSPYILGRLLNNLERYKPGDDRYTMQDMFTDMRKMIWSELDGPTNVNSFRRQLQLSHLNQLMGIYLGSTMVYPHDAITLAANDIDILESGAKRAVASSAVNDMTKAHYKEVLRQIAAAKSASRDFSILAR